MKANSFPGVGIVVLFAVLIVATGLAFLASPLNPLRPERLENAPLFPNAPTTSLIPIPKAFEGIDITPMTIIQEGDKSGTGIGTETSRLVMTWHDTPDGGCEYRGNYYAGRTVFELPPTYLSDPCNVTDGIFFLHQIINNIKESQLIRDNRLLQELEIIFTKAIGWFQSLIP